MDGDEIFDADFQFPLALIVGSEGYGISRPLLNLADYKIRIPLVGKIESLNAASSAAIALFWLFFKRK